MAKYVTLENLTAFAAGLVTKITGKFVAKETGKGLSSNDYTSAEKTKLAGLMNYTHPTTSGNKHIPAGGSSGQILRWSAAGTATWGADNNTTYNPMTGATASAAGTQGLVPAPAAGKQTSFLRGDGTWAVPAGGQTNVIETVKVNNTALAVTNKAVNIDLSGYATKADVTSVYKVKGSKASYSALPSTGNVTGDVWNLDDTGANYVWTGTAWDKLSETVDLSGYMLKTDITEATTADIDNIINGLFV